MARQAWPTVLTGDSWSAAQHNTYGRDNEAAHWPYTTAGDMPYATSSTTLGRIPISSPFFQLRVNAAGTAPAWSGAIFSLVSRVANQSISNNSATNISFDTEVNDTSAFWTAGSPTIFTIPVTGYYQISGFISFADNSTGMRYASLQSGGEILCEDQRIPVSGNVTSIPVAALHRFTVGATISIFVYQNSGGALNATGKLGIVFLGS